MYIYKIEFKNGSIYVGKTTLSIENRFVFHYSLMKRGKHHSHKLQAAYNQHGKPEVSIVEALAPGDDSDAREQYWIQYYDSYNNGLNCTPGGGKYYGQNNKYCEEDYLSVVYLSANTDLTIKEISDELSITHGVVQSIMYGKSHGYLKDLAPEEYRKMLGKLGQRNLKKGRQINVRGPDGTVHTVLNASEFSRQHGLQQSNFNQVLTGQRKSHLGWSLADPEERNRLLNNSPLAKVKSPSGDVVAVYNYKQFTKEHGLNLTAFKRMLSGEFKQHKGWVRYE